MKTIRYFFLALTWLREGLQPPQPLALSLLGCAVE